MLHVRPAAPADVPVIIGFIDEAADWLAAKGTDQWARPWPNRRRRDGRVRRGVRDRCTWMVEEDGSPIATISCYPAGNRDLWTGSELAQPAVYLSRLIVRRGYGGQDLGTELINWAGLWAARQYGAQWIRIDAWTTNEPLHSYYRQRGFVFRRQADKIGYPSAMLLEKRTDSISLADVPRLAEVPVLRRPDKGRGPASLSLAPLGRSRQPQARHARARPAPAQLTQLRPRRVGRQLACLARTQTALLWTAAIVAGSAPLQVAGEGRRRNLAVRSAASLRYCPRPVPEIVALPSTASPS